MIDYCGRPGMTAASDFTEPAGRVARPVLFRSANLDSAVRVSAGADTKPVYGSLCGNQETSAAWVLETTHFSAADQPSTFSFPDLL
jgi:hypothetical protein